MSTNYKFFLCVFLICFTNNLFAKCLYKDFNILNADSLTPNSLIILETYVLNRNHKNDSIISDFQFFIIQKKDTINLELITMTKGVLLQLVFKPQRLLKENIKSKFIIKYLKKRSNYDFPNFKHSSKRDFKQLDIQVTKKSPNKKSGWLIKPTLINTEYSEPSCGVVNFARFKLRLSNSNNQLILVKLNSLESNEKTIAYLSYQEILIIGRTMCDGIINLGEGTYSITFQLVNYENEQLSSESEQIYFTSPLKLKSK